MFFFSISSTVANFYTTLAIYNTVENNKLIIIKKHDNLQMRLKVATNKS